MVLLKLNDLISIQEFYEPKLSKKIPQKEIVTEEEIYFINKIEKTSA